MYVDRLLLSVFGDFCVVSSALEKSSKVELFGRAENPRPAIGSTCIQRTSADCHAVLSSNIILFAFSSSSSLVSDPLLCSQPVHRADIANAADKCISLMQCSAQWF